MSNWSLSIVEATVADFANAADTAYQAYKDDTEVNHEGHVHAAIDAAMEGVKTLVASGIFGSHKVSAVVTGLAHPNFAAPDGVAPNQASINLYEVPSPAEAVAPQSAADRGVATSDPHQDQVPPPGPLGAAQTPASSYAGVSSSPPDDDDEDDKP